MASSEGEARRFGIGLPLALSSFVGREPEIVEVLRLLEDVRLLTLVGTGGVGKTRLAVEVARRVEAERIEDAVFVDLSRFPEPSLVSVAVAAELGVRDQPNRPIMELLIATINAGPLLLLLDNCEHQVAGCAQLAEQLLRACPALRILATSREPLRMAGETVWQVPTLSVPDRRDPMGPTELAKAEAARLFTERARAFRPDFAVTAGNARDIAELCRRLDGLPLALELAAAQMTVVGTRELVERLDEPLRVLARGSRTASPRHQTLRAALDWSYELLSPPERRLFERVSVFAGGWNLAAMEAVCSDGLQESAALDSAAVADSLRAGDVLSILGRLIDTSLILTEPGEDGMLRYRVLETVRAYARERLAARGELDAVRRRHVHYYLGLVEQAVSELRGGPNQVVWLTRLEREHDQLRAALEWVTSSGQSELGLRLAGGLWRFWWLHSHISEGLMWLDTALAHDGGTVTQRATALNGAGILAHTRGDLDRAELLLGQALELWHQTSDLRGEAATLHNLGSIARERADFTRAVDLYTQSLALERQRNDTWGIAVSLSGLAKAAHAQGQLERAAALQEEGIQLARKIDDRRSIAIGLVNLAEITRDLGDYSRAASLATQSLELWEVLGDRFARATVLSDLARLAWLEGDCTRALGSCIESLEVFREVESKQGIAIGLETLAAILGVLGKPGRAATIFGAADALREAVGSPVTPAERPIHLRMVQAARDAIGPDVFDRAWAEGRHLRMDEAINSALAELRDGLISAEEPSTNLSGTQAAAARAVARPTQPHPSAAPLTAREIEVLARLALGMTNRQIADELVIGVRTAETHVERILRKLNFQNRAQAMVWARERGLGQDAPMPRGTDHA